MGLSAKRVRVRVRVRVRAFGTGNSRWDAAWGGDEKSIGVGIDGHESTHGDGES